MSITAGCSSVWQAVKLLSGPILVFTYHFHQHERLATTLGGAQNLCQNIEKMRADQF